MGNYSTEKFNVNADATNHDFNELAQKFVDAGLKMKNHGYFEPISWSAKTKLVFYLLTRFGKNNMKICYDQIMSDKHSHNHPVNKFCHFWSSVFMILVAYPQLFVKSNALLGCLWFFSTAHVVRQAGHFFMNNKIVTLRN